MTYTSGIPVPTDNPSDDVGPMQQNSIAINNWVAVDHVGFNTATSGEHKQVTFASVNVPSVPTTPPVLFTNIQDGAMNALPGGLAQLFFYSGTDVQGQNNNVIAPNGSIMLMGGIILKWLLTATSSGGTPFTFGSPALPFPNNLFAITIGGLAGGAEAFCIKGQSVSGGVALSPNAQTAYIIAIGN